MGLIGAQTIDVHAHVVLDATMGAAGAQGPELTIEQPPRFRAGDYERGQGAQTSDVVIFLHDVGPKRARRPSPGPAFHPGSF